LGVRDRPALAHRLTAAYEKRGAVRDRRGRRCGARPEGRTLLRAGRSRHDAGARRARRGGAREDARVASRGILAREARGLVGRASGGGARHDVDGGEAARASRIRSAPRRARSGSGGVVTPSDALRARVLAAAAKKPSATRAKGRQLLIAIVIA